MFTKQTFEHFEHGFWKLSRKPPGVPQKNFGSSAFEELFGPRCRPRQLEHRAMGDAPTNLEVDRQLQGPAPELWVAKWIWQSRYELAPFWSIKGLTGFRFQTWYTSQSSLRVNPSACHPCSRGNACAVLSHNHSPFGLSRLSAKSKRSKLSTAYFLAVGFLWKFHSSRPFILNEFETSIGGRIRRRHVATGRHNGLLTTVITGKAEHIIGDDWQTHSTTVNSSFTAINFYVYWKKCVPTPQLVIQAMHISPTIMLDLHWVIISKKSVCVAVSSQTITRHRTTGMEWMEQSLPLRVRTHKPAIQQKGCVPAISSLGWSFPVFWNCKPWFIDSTCIGDVRRWRPLQQRRRQSTNRWIINVRNKTSCRNIGLRPTSLSQSHGATGPAL